MYQQQLRHFCRILLSLICLLPAFAVIAKHHSLDVNQSLIIICTSVCNVIFLACLYKYLPRTISLLSGILALLAVGEYFFILEYLWTINANTLSLLLETNPAEAADYLNSLPKWGIIFFLFPVLLTIGAFSRYRSIFLGFRWQKWGIIGSAVVWIGIIATATLLVPTEPTISQAPTPFPVQENDQALALRAAYPAGLPWVFYDFFTERKALNTVVTEHKSFRFSITPPPSVGHRRIDVLVIGESSRGDHWGINGYARDTTPELMTRHDIIPFRRMYTHWTYTRLAVPTMISRKPPTLPLDTFPEASIVTVFKQAGFHTAWISLQAPVGEYDSPVAEYAAEADEVHFLNPVDYRFHGNHDDAAITELQHVIAANPARDLFVVIHLLGSHFRYTDRYPRSFAHFLPDNPPEALAELFDRSDKQELVNGYDNSILFTDHVINSLINELAAQKDASSWLLYSSDHGEALFDDCRMQSGHGTISRATQLVSALFWASPVYRTEHPGKISELESHANALTSTAMFFETMTDLANIKVAGDRPDNSLASSPLRVPVEVAHAEDPYQCSHG